ncbi:putative leader peptide [Streptomyces sp. NPDC001809]
MGRSGRHDTPPAAPLPRSLPLTSRRHIDLLRVSSAASHGHRRTVHPAG